RNVLSRRVANDDAAFRRLENIVHPLVMEARRKFLIDAEKRGSEIVVLDIPLLYETGGEKQVDVVIVVTAPSDIQRERALARPGMTPDKLDAIHARQVPDAEKREKANFIVETGKGREHAMEAVKRVVATLRSQAAKPHITTKAKAKTHARS